jgi:hypothetical protein
VSGAALKLPRLTVDIGSGVPMKGGSPGLDHLDPSGMRESDRLRGHRRFAWCFPVDSPGVDTRVYGDNMAINLWLSAEEERVLEGIMRHEGTRTKEQAVIMAILDKGATLAADRQAREIPAAVAGGLSGQSISAHKS